MSWHLSYGWGKTSEKISTRKLTRPGIEPGSAAWQALATACSRAINSISHNKLISCCNTSFMNNHKKLKNAYFTNFSYISYCTYLCKAQWIVLSFTFYGRPLRVLILFMPRKHLNSLKLFCYIEHVVNIQKISMQILRSCSQKDIRTIILDVRLEIKGRDWDYDYYITKTSVRSEKMRPSRSAHSTCHSHTSLFT